MNQEQFYKHLELILSLMGETKAITISKSPIGEDAERRQLTNQFMSRYFELYLVLRSNPSLKLDKKYENFIEQSQYFLTHLTFELNHYVIEIENRLRTIFEYNEWEAIICQRRSAVEAVKEMYRDTSFEEFYEGENSEALILDTEDLDDSIEMKAHKEGYLKEDQIPKEIPTSHWWWWSPEEPPSSR